MVVVIAVVVLITKAEGKNEAEQIVGAVFETEVNSMSLLPFELCPLFLLCLITRPEQHTDGYLSWCVSKKTVTMDDDEEPLALLMFESVQEKQATNNNMLFSLSLVVFDLVVAKLAAPKWGGRRQIAKHSIISFYTNLFNSIVQI